MKPVFITLFVLAALAVAAASGLAPAPAEVDLPSPNTLMLMLAGFSALLSPRQSKKPAGKPAWRAL